MMKKHLNLCLTLLLIASLFCVLFLTIQPINRLSILCAQIFLSLLSLAIIIYFTWNRRNIVLFIILILTIPLAPLVNIYDIDRNKLNSMYVNELRKYDGCKYIWGGENSLGIDCSGLPRKAMRTSLIKYGYFYFNGNAIILGVWMAFNDASALEMLNGYSGMTTTVSGTYKINDLSNVIVPGDMAITINGIHCMVYLDKSYIIQADPGREMVVIDTLPSDNSWYSTNVKVVRWNYVK